MKGVSAMIADRGVGCGCACQVEDDAGIRPFLEPRKTRHEYRDWPKHFPNAQYGYKVGWVAKDMHKAIDSALHADNLSNTAAAYKKRYEYGRSPISDASSEGRCNTFLQFTRGSLELQSFPRALIQAQGYLVQFLLGMQ